MLAELLETERIYVAEMGSILKVSLRFYNIYPCESIAISMGQMGFIISMDTASTDFSNQDHVMKENESIRH